MLDGRASILFVVGSVDGAASHCRQTVIECLCPRDVRFGRSRRGIPNSIRLAADESLQGSDRLAPSESDNLPLIHQAPVHFTGIL